MSSFFRCFKTGSRTTRSEMPAGFLPSAAIALVMSVLVLSIPAAVAGQRANSHVRLNPGAKLEMQHHDSGGMRTGGPRRHKPHLQAARHKPLASDNHAASSGVLLANGRRTNATDHRVYPVLRRHDRIGKHPRNHTRNHRRNRHQAGQVLIINFNQGIDEGYDEAGGRGASPQGAMLDGNCASGAYCSIRLGPYSNSPKIITLNSGSSLSGVKAGAQSLESSAPDLDEAGPQVIEPDEAELKRKYGDK